MNIVKHLAAKELDISRVEQVETKTELKERERWIYICHVTPNITLNGC